LVFRRIARSEILISAKAHAKEASVKLEEKYEIIRAKEERFAFELAKQLIERPQASVWLIFLPILFVFHAQRIQKYKSSIRTFADGFLRTKILALDAALEEVKTGKFPGRIMDTIAQDSDTPAKTEMRAKQREEVDLLRQHYLLLLKSSGESFPELLTGAYPTSGGYRAFLNRLLQAEKEVNELVTKVMHPTPEAEEAVVRMENLSQQLRQKELQEIFGK
jgi:hypothetical protein